MSRDIYCRIEGCHRLQKAKCLCAKHYNIEQKAKSSFIKCQVPDCNNNALYNKRTLCLLHFGRWYRHGETKSKIPNYGKHSIIHEQGYKMLWINGKYVMEHVYLAEKALGHPLPSKAVVHHMNKNVRDNYTPFNLVICPDQSYHMHIHRRMKEYEQRQQTNPHRS